MNNLQTAIFIAVLTLTTFGNTASASSGFTTDAVATYEVEENGLTKITHDITLTNLTSQLHAKTYKLYLHNLDPKTVRIFEEDKVHNLNVHKYKDYSEIEIIFSDAVVGLGKSRNFKITYYENDTAKKAGEIWEIQIPKLKHENDFASYSLYLSIPHTLGEEAYLNPTETDKILTEDKYIYFFEKEKLTRNSISAAFGSFQLYNFDISYYLENPTNRAGVFKVAIPPDTNLQRVYYDVIDPAPSEIEIDIDGNWIAKYHLSPRERVNIKTKGNVRIFSEPQKHQILTEEQIATYTSPTTFWQSDSNLIARASSGLNTPREIFEYVVETLSYDYKRVRPDAERFGAIKALENPGSAICMEFTDLFIALARSKGIPAREINGYAYTENPHLEPLSLVADILHSWPEYWDYEDETWKAVDPTWASTSGRDAYYDKLDMKHFTFAIHGASDTLPLPAGSYKMGGNPKKDVHVNFGSMEPSYNQNINISASLPSRLSLIDRKVPVVVSNEKGGSLYGLVVDVFFDSKKVHSEYVEMLPPYSSATFDISLSKSFFNSNTPDEIKIVASDEETIVYTNKNLSSLLNTLILSAILFMFLVISMLKFHKPNKDRVKNAKETIKEKLNIFFKK